VAGNKADLPAESWEVASDDARAYATSIGAAFFETSAKDDVGVDDLFATVASHAPLTYDDGITAADQFRLDTARGGGPSSRQQPHAGSRSSSSSSGSCCGGGGLR